MIEEFHDLAADLKNFCGSSPVYFFANPGNWGDALIRQGTLKFFEEIGLEYTELQRKASDWILPLIRGGAFIYGGSGAWCRFYNTGEKYTRVITKRSRVFVLPSTFEKAFDVPRATFYRRDEFGSKEAMPHAKFCHDMAFCLENMERPPGKGVGYFFRLDPERDPENTIIEGNRDISQEGNQLTDTEAFFDEIAAYETIYTDRLHVAIACCLMNRKVHLYMGNYFKIKAIYDSSIKGRYPQCILHTTPFTGPESSDQ